MIAALKEDCRRDILELPGKLGRTAADQFAGDPGQAVASPRPFKWLEVAEALIQDVSDAAFKLEAVAKEIPFRHAGPRTQLGVRCGKLCQRRRDAGLRRSAPDLSKTR